MSLRQCLEACFVLQEWAEGKYKECTVTSERAFAYLSLFTRQVIQHARQVFQLQCSPMTKPNEVDVIYCFDAGC